MKPFVPQVSQIEPRTVLSVITLGDPNKVAQPYMKALYGTAYQTKMKFYKPQNKKMEIGKLSAFWPDAHLKPKDQWTGIWNLEVSDFVKQQDLMQKNPQIMINLEKLKGGQVAEILHLGPYSEEWPTVQKLHVFIKEQKLEIIGNHEEIYLTSPSAKEQKTLIRYLVK